MKDHNIDYSFLIRIIIDDVTEDEKRFFADWLQSSEENKRFYEEIKELWGGIGERSSQVIPPDARKQFSEIKSKIAERENRTERRKNDATPRKLRRRIPKRRSVTVGIFALLAGLTFLYLVYSVTQIGTPDRVAEEVTKVETAPGQQRVIDLKEGIQVHLNVASTLNIHPNQPSNGFTMELDGEAFFRVKNDDESPFIVKTGATITKVTGTEFNISYRNGEYSVAVKQGSVNVDNESIEAPVRIDEGYGLRVSNSDQLDGPYPIDINDHLAWLDSKFVFDRVPLERVMQELALYYNIKVEFRDHDAKKKTLTGVFERRELSEILQAISFAMGVTISEDNKVVIIE